MNDGGILMAKSQLIKDIATNKINLEEALQRLLIISSNLEIDKIEDWIINELNGYGDKIDLPLYRKNIGYTLVYSGINGYFNMTNQPLTLNFFPKELRDIIDETEFRENIRVAEKAVFETNKLGKDLSDLAGAVYSETGVKCYRIFKEYNIISIDGIISQVKNKLLLFLLKLEKNFGNLDSLDINVDSLTIEDTQKIEHDFNMIIYDDKVEQL